MHTRTYIYLCMTHFFRVGFADKANKDVVNTLVTEVKSHLPDVLSVTIKGITLPRLHGMYELNVDSMPSLDAARTYFNSVSGVSRLKATGKYAAKIALQRRKNRLMRVCYFFVTYYFSVLTMLMFSISRS